MDLQKDLLVYDMPTTGPGYLCSLQRKRALWYCLLLGHKEIQSLELGVCSLNHRSKGRLIIFSFQFDFINGERLQNVLNASHNLLRLVGDFYFLVHF